MKFNEKQPEGNMAIREHWPWVWGRDINVVFMLGSRQAQTSKVIKTKIT
jgi:hypothetical protein